MQLERGVSGAAVCARTAQEAAAKPPGRSLNSRMSLHNAHVQSDMQQLRLHVAPNWSSWCDWEPLGAAATQGMACTRRTQTGQDTTFSTCHQLSCIRSDPLTAIPSSPTHRRRRLVPGDCYTARFHPLLDLPRLKMSAPCGNTDSVRTSGPRSICAPHIHRTDETRAQAARGKDQLHQLVRLGGVNT